MVHTKLSPIDIDSGIWPSNCLWPQPIEFNDTSRLADLEPFYLGWQGLKWPRRTWFRLFNTYQHFQPFKLPDHYDLYVLSYHGEQIDFEWLATLDSSKPVILVSDSNLYDSKILPQNVRHVRWLVWHHFFDRMLTWFGSDLPTKNILYKASAICHRITQSKIWTTTAMLEHLPEQDRLVALGDWLIDKDIHDWESTGNIVLDDLTSIFKRRYLGRIMRFDSFTQQDNNHQTTTNPNSKSLNECALHFTNESFHYSHMLVHDVETILPGPFLTEKTFKCLFSATAFIPVGQFDTYNTLAKLGFVFDYGLDTVFDSEPQNMLRFEALVNFVRDLDKCSAQDLYETTRPSSEYNATIIRSGLFQNRCKLENEKNLMHLQTALDEIHA
jgi:hypothetical protein